MDLRDEEILADIEAERKLTTPLCEKCGVNSQVLMFGYPMVVAGLGAICRECLQQVLDNGPSEVVK